MNFGEGRRREGWDGWKWAKDRSEELFSPAGAVVLVLSLVQLHGQIWERQWDTFWWDADIRFSHYSHKHQILEPLFIFIFFSWHLSPSLNIYPYITEAPPLLWLPLPPLRLAHALLPASHMVWSLLPLVMGQQLFSDRKHSLYRCVCSSES